MSNFIFPSVHPDEENNLNNNIVIYRITLMRLNFYTNPSPPSFHGTKLIM